MSVLGEVLDELAENIIPDVASIVFPDTCFVQRPTESKDSAGNVKKVWADDNAEAIPCVYEPRGISIKSEITGKWESIQGYKLTLPTNQDSALIDLNPKTDRIRVVARGNQLQKIFKIISLGNDSGVINELYCQLEN